MKRRQLLTLGAGASLSLSLVAWWSIRVGPAFDGSRLTSPARGIFDSVGAALLDGSLPREPVARAAALSGMLERIETLVAGLPAVTRAELSELLAILALPPGRVALFGLTSDWTDTSVVSMQAQLGRLRTSAIGLRQQVYHAFHEIVHGAYFADEKTWPDLGYSGPVRL